MSIPASIEHAIAAEVGDIADVRPVGGGCIANAIRIEAGGRTLFLKWTPAPAGETFEAEAACLNALAAADSSLLIPAVFAAKDAQSDEPGFLLLTWIEPGTPDSGFGRRLGDGLAALHEATEDAGRYGFERDNFIGRLPQKNDWSGDWQTFFREMRLEPQIQMARENERWHTSWNPLAESLFSRLPDLLPHDPPASICHGDLWSGNVIYSENGIPALVDPAAYFGHGETDLAMMTLFGGFDRSVFDAYHNVHLKQSDHDDRESVYQLYHLINHLNHFGEGYSGGVQRILRRFA